MKSERHLAYFSLKAPNFSGDRLLVGLDATRDGGSDRGLSSRSIDRCLPISGPRFA